MGLVKEWEFCVKSSKYSYYNVLEAILDHA